MVALKGLHRLAPGIALCGLVVAAAWGVQSAEIALFGRAHLEALVLAILLGVIVRSTVGVHGHFGPGIGFSGSTLLEIAIALLGLTVSLHAVVQLGPWLVLAIAAMVSIAIPVSYLIGRGLGLAPRMALLVACGNAICGNSAIAAVAPAIGAEKHDVAASISFTAVLGVVVVLSLPLAMTALHLNVTQYGILAGLTVYAVPQVLAAAAPAGVVAVQIGTLVKLIRVAMLGPVVTSLSLIAARHPAFAQPQATRGRKTRLMPWFILAFLAAVLIRATGLVPDAVVAQSATVSGLLTVMSMAALGLGVDVRSVAKAGPAVTATVVFSLGFLGILSLLLIWLLGGVAA